MHTIKIIILEENLKLLKKNPKEYIEVDGFGVLNEEVRDVVLRRLKDAN